MSWLKFDDAFPEHPKIDRVGGDAGWLYICATAYSSRQRTDGFIRKPKLLRLTDRKNVPKLLKLMVEERLLHAPGDSGCESESCPAHYQQVPEDEYLIHDYWEHNPTRAEQEGKEATTSAERSKAGKAGAHSRWHKDAPNPDCPHCIEDGKAHGNAIANGSQTDDPDPTRPDPSLSTDFHTQTTDISEHSPDESSSSDFESRFEAVIAALVEVAKMRNRNGYTTSETAFAKGCAENIRAEKGDAIRHALTELALTPIEVLALHEADELLVRQAAKRSGLTKEAAA